MPDSEIKIASNVMAKSYAGSSFNFFLNGVLVGEQIIGQVPNTTYGPKGRHAIDTFKINATASSASARTSQEVKFQFQFVKNDIGSATGFIDHFLLSFKRKLALYESQTIFSSVKSLENTSSTFEVESIGSGASIWEITDPFNATDLKFTITGSKGIFSTPTQALKS